MPELPEALGPKAGPPLEPGTEYRIITYRTVAFYAFLALAAVAVALYFLAPETIGKRVDALFARKPVVDAGYEQKQARFLNLDGAVRVKKSSAVEWATANQGTLLEKGDVVRTGSDGMARIGFADNTMFVMRADTLITIEENSTHLQTKATNVAVDVTSGTVDLATTSFQGESTVKFANAVAHMRQDSHALVKNDPNSETHEILVTKGGSEVLRGSERMELGQYEKVSFKGRGEDAQMVRERAMGPPLLISPANLTPLMVSDPKNYSLNFSWTPVPGATSYRVRVSTSSIFAKLVYDRSTKGTSLKATGIPEGTYYWAVSSVGVNDKESENSDASKFTLVRQGSDKDEIMLIVDEYVQQGKAFVIAGRTEPGARVMVNDEPVFNVNADGSFKHFTSPFAKPGGHEITVTAQNSKGRIATRRKTVYIEQ